MPTITQPFAGKFEADPVHSSFGFAVRHMGVSTFRGTLGDVSARLRPTENAGLQLEGEAPVESISITAPSEFRAHVLGEDFFHAEAHPTVAFRSDDVRLAADGGAQVRGRLTIKDVTREVVAVGSYDAPAEDPYGSQRGALTLEVTIDRRDFEMRWNSALPSGSDALGHEVKLTVELELVEALDR